MNCKYSVSIIIPNWNGKNLLEKHLPAVIKAAKDCEIIVVDDASTDDSVDFVATRYPHIRLIQKTTHDGFSSAVNTGVNHASGDIVVLLNSDVEPEENFLDSLIPHFSDSSVFAVGCMDKSVEGDQIVFRGRGIAYWRKGMIVHERGEVDKTDTAWVSGGSGAFRRSYWIELGGMDELFNPFYWEDIDLSYRARKSGYRILFEPRSVVIHRHEEGMIKTTMKASYIRRVAYRNQLLCTWKNITDYSYLFEHAIYLHIRLVQSFITRDMSFILGYLDALKRLFVILKKRKEAKRFFKRKDQELLKRC